MDANPARHHGRPAGFYGKPVDAQGLSPVSLKRPESPASRESRRCPECSSKLWLLDGADEATCTCGAVVTR
jgi:hypothetical protein